jgi:hypothetical protein
MKSCGKCDETNRPSSQDNCILQFAEDMYFVIVDLQAQKDTVEILARLNRCYPFAESEIERGEF